MRKEREAELERKREEQKRQAEEDKRRSLIFEEEFANFRENLEDRIASRREKEALWHQEKDDFIDAAAILMEEELRKQAMIYLQAYAEELTFFAKNLDKRRRLRKQAEDEYRKKIEERELLRRERLAKKSLGKE